MKNALGKFPPESSLSLYNDTPLTNPETHTQDRFYYLDADAGGEKTI